MVHQGAWTMTRMAANRTKLSPKMTTGTAAMISDECLMFSTVLFASTLRRARWMM
jgi:hypothetical protein